MKAMVIGLGPEYNYPGQLGQWSANNTRYASNFGASLICRSIMKQFSAEYVDDFSDIAGLREKYDVCILALATHATNWRDVSFYVRVVEQLRMKSVVLSLGIQDFAQATSEVFTLHPSIRRLLEIASESTPWIGVRGPYTASILMKNGFRNVVPVGCPTMYWGLRGDLKINKPESFSNPLIVYHQSICSMGTEFIEKYPFMGQDFEDEAFFTDHFPNDIELKYAIGQRYQKFPDFHRSLAIVKRTGKFPESFDDWFSTIGQQDFVFGSRLHGCIAALIQGIPAVMTPRDLRVRELTEFYNIPNIPLSQLQGKDAAYLFSRASYERFNNTYPIRFSNYVHFLDENGLENTLDRSMQFPDVRTTLYDSQINQVLLYEEARSNRNLFQQSLSRITELLKQKFSSPCVL